MLLRASRGAWRLKPPVALLCGEVTKGNFALSARCLSSAGSEEWDADALRTEGGKTASQQEEICWKTTPWEKMLVALRAYKEINGDTLVPQSFVVPSGDARWPRAAWGYALGEGVGSLRKKAGKYKISSVMDTEVKEMKFAQNARQFQWDEIIMPALRHFYQVHGHTDVPRTFVVPDSDDAWPRLSWNWPLGVTAHRIRIENAYARQVKGSEEELKEMKLCYEMTMTEREWNEKILPALKVFRQVHHHCLVGSSFKVPHAAPWPEEAWGLRLGPIVSQIRVGNNYVKLAERDKDILNEIGFAWDHDLSIWNERIIPALQAYVAEFKTCRMPWKFVVPACDPWPKSAWNMALGKQVYNMKYRGYYFSYIGRDIDRLKVLGFSFELRRQAWGKIVDPLLDIHESCYGDKAVPHDFVIPSQAPWPKKRWGVHLGAFVANNTWAREGIRNE
ncbi:hypothetical protein PR003_g12549 [Phytophthora rubi]|uniref:Helicase-associated domain-containing protein n=1 Tax=Phytophthora rubi TaxID=129364 RepID=A0A6A4EZX0_9STRA|nr:hypothetical protein PR002_g12182 [Phytophthora rubi]KAE9028356.1 hypothetical protein PR001_g11758 [Phytophthora rubi]KAE9336358.1 hypothetical protein PR003_g12549 [Phytophthora rubi]